MSVIIAGVLFRGSVLLGIVLIVIGVLLGGLHSRKGAQSRTVTPEVAVARRVFVRQGGSGAGQSGSPAVR